MRIAVIGGGAAGFMAAITAKQSSPKSEVFLFEKSNKLLSKVKVSGGGRCNVTNACFSISELSKKYPRGGAFLKKSFPTGLNLGLLSLKQKTIIECFPLLIILKLLSIVCLENVKMKG
jgi:predicted flavoprotein YhiN